MGQAEIGNKGVVMAVALSGVVVYGLAASAHDAHPVKHDQIIRALNEHIGDVEAHAGSDGTAVDGALESRVAAAEVSAEGTIARVAELQGEVEKLREAILAETGDDDEKDDTPSETGSEEEEEKGFLAKVAEYGPEASAGAAGGGAAVGGGWLLIKQGPEILNFLQGLLSKLGKGPKPRALTGRRGRNGNSEGQGERNTETSKKDGRAEEKTSAVESYFVNRNKNARDGLHQVHKTSCDQVFVDEANRVSLGECESAAEAVGKAKRMGFSPADGCALCSAEAHDSD